MPKTDSAVANTAARPSTAVETAPFAAPNTSPAKLQIRFHDHLVHDAYSKKMKQTKKKLRRAGAALATGVERHRDSPTVESCSECRKVLGNGQGAFRSRVDSNVVMCQACMDALQSRHAVNCSVCEEAIANDQPFYRSRVDEGKCICSSCAEAMKASSSRPKRPSSCTDCRRPFGPDDPIFGSSVDGASLLCQVCAESRNAERTKTCSACNRPFRDGQKAFKSKADDGALLCQGCAESSLPACAACGRPALGSVGKLGDKVYHAECLACYMCMGRISGQCSQTPQGLVCRSCAETVEALTRRARELTKKGDIKGAEGIVARLRRLTSPAPRDEELQAKLLEIFRHWDSNADGVISRGELRRVLVDIGIDEAGVETIFDSADLRRDGKISYHEFVRWICAPANEDVLEHLSALVVRSPKHAPPATSSNLRTPLELLSSYWARR